jgi:hypothetical protein
MVLSLLLAVFPGQSGLAAVPLPGSVNADSIVSQGPLPGELATTQDRIDQEWPSVFRWLTDVQKQDVQNHAGNLDLTSAIAAAYRASKQLLFPPGVYKVSALPNFNVAGTRIIALGAVQINVTGANAGLVADAGAAGNVFDVEVSGLTLNGNPAATDGVFIRGVHHSSFRRIRVRNFAQNALNAQFMVCNTFEQFVCSGNEGPMDTLPRNGITLDQRGAGSACSACVFVDPVIEGMPGNGLNLLHAMQCDFQGGTAEANGVNLYESGSCAGNRFKLDLEAAATGVDIIANGEYSSFDTMLCAGLVDLGGLNQHLHGGQYEGGITIENTALRPKLDTISYAGLITDASASAIYVDVYFQTCASYHADSYAKAVSGSWAPASNLGGASVMTAKYWIVGPILYFSVRIQSPTGTAATAGLSRISQPPGHVSSLANGGGSCLAASNTTGRGYGNGGLAPGNFYLPAWPSDPDVSVSGWYMIQ